MTPSKAKDLNAVIESLIRRGCEEMADGRHDHAIITFRRGIELAPLRQDIRDYLAMALDRKAPAGVEVSAVEERELEVDSLAATTIDESLADARPVRKTRSHVRLPGWMMILTVVICVVIVSAIYVFNRYSEAMKDLVQRAKTINLPAEIVQARNYHKMARQDMDAGDYLGAIKFVNEALESNTQAAESNPSDAAEYRALKASAYLALGDDKLEDMKYTEALGHYSKAVEADPESAEAYFNVGLCSQRLALYAKRRNQSEEADKFFNHSVQALERALELSPSHAQSMVLLQEIYPKLGRYKEMVNISYTILEAMPADDPAAVKARSYLGSYGLPLTRSKAKAPAPEKTAPTAPPTKIDNPTP